MIHRLGLRNFKCFIQTDVEFGPLNVLAGSNGTGKSTIVQALLVLFQSVQSGAIGRNRLQLNGPLVDLGTGRDVLYKRSEADHFGIEVRDGSGNWKVTATVPASEFQHTLDVVDDPKGAVPRCFHNQVLYLSADRLAPQKSYPMNLDDSFGNDVGRRGEFAPLLYSRSRSSNVENDQLILETIDKKRFTDIETQFSLWMARLFPGFVVRTDTFDQLDTVMLGLNLQKQIGEPEFLRPSNVGFGVSVAFPIILAGLLAGMNTTLIVENPEAHLHPSAQSLIGEFLARVAAGGAQLFVETHSDHVVNGLRIAFKNKIISSDNLRFFAFAKTDEYGSQHATLVSLDESGDFFERPDSFFDQTDKDLKLIYGF
jgi:predicted ATPase